MHQNRFMSVFLIPSARWMDENIGAKFAPLAGAQVVACFIDLAGRSD